MAATAPMRDGPPAGSGTGGDSRVTTTTSATSAAAAATTTTNFEYDESEWDIGIGNLIIDLDADIEKTNEKSNVGNLNAATPAANQSNSSTSAVTSGSSTGGAGSNNTAGGGSMAAASSANAANSGSGSGNANSNSGSGASGGSKSGKSSGGGGSSGAAASGNASAGGGGVNAQQQASSVEHSSIVDKGLKMKIKRTTKSGSKSSEKHEIVKPSEQNGSDAGAALCNSGDAGAVSKGSTSAASLAAAVTTAPSAGKHSSSGSGAANAGVPLAAVNSGGSSSGSNSTNIAAGANCLTNASAGANSVSNKRASGSSHRRDKTKEKHAPGAAGASGASSSSDKTVSSKSSSATALAATLSQSQPPSQALLSAGSVPGASDLNGIVRPSAQRVMYPMQTNGPGPPNAPGPPPSPSKEQQQSASKPAAVAVAPFGSGAGAPSAIPATCAVALQTSATQVTATSVATNALAAGALSQTAGAIATSTTAAGLVGGCGVDAVLAPTTGLIPGVVGPSVNSAFTPAGAEDISRPESPSSPPCKKLKTANCLINDNKETKDACVGTSISTMTEPDCLGPCEPGTSVTLEGIVWHETEGVLVVNVTWRGKTYVGTLLDCTRHDWAPPRFCDSPTSDLDARLPKGRAKRGRAATNDLSNFTETRSSVHSKLRSSSIGSNKGNRKGLSNSPTPFVPPRPDSGGNKRKSRPGADDESPSPQANCKKSKPSAQSSASATSTPVSPPSTTSPVFYECPETNCCKKYRHINGLKYHQSHAHGGCAADDDDPAKESGSMSENEELPSPIDQQAIKCERKDEISESEPATPSSEPAAGATGLLHPGSPHNQQSVSASSLMPEDPPPVPVEPSPPPVDNKTVVKPGVLRYGLPASLDDSIATQASALNASKTAPPVGTSATQLPGLRPPTTTSSLAPSMPLTLTSAPAHTMTSPSPPIVQPIPLSPGQPTQPLLPHAFSASQHLQPAPQPTLVAQPAQSLPLNPTPSPKLPQFKVKPASALLQDDKSGKEKTAQVAKLQQHQQRKKSRKSPAGSPHSHHSASEQSAQFKMDASSRDEVRSPAYSDISDDGAPVLEAEVSDAKKAPLPMDKKIEVSGGAPSPHAMQHYGSMYTFYAQPPYLVPSVQPDTKPKDEKLQEGAKISGLPAAADKELKKESDMVSAQKLMPQHYYPQFDYMGGYGYGNYPLSMVAQSGAGDKDIKEENSKSPGPTDLVKQPSGALHGAPLSQYSAPTLPKTKIEPPAKMAGDAYSAVKERADARSPLGSASYLQARQQAQMQHQQQLHQQQMQHHQMQAHGAPPANMHHAQSAQQQQMQQQLMQQQAQQAHHLAASHQSHEDMRRYFGNMFPEQQAPQPQQRRKDSLLQQPPQQHPSHAEAPLKATPPPNAVGAKAPPAKHKEKAQQVDDKKEEKVAKQEGVKPTMETQGPPPPPTSSYYFPSHYLQPPYHSPIAFDQAHMYRGMSPMMVPAGPYGNSPYLHHPSQMHPQMSRYHAPEDLSRPPSGSSSKALDMLHQASQYYPSTHKIHELQERAIKSPTPKVATTNASAVAAPNGQPQALSAQLASAGGADRLSAQGGAQGAKNSAIDGKDSRSPPPQRHVHTHHHTHVGLGYPLLPGQYPAPYQAAVLASEQAAGVASTGSNPYSPK